MIQNPAIRPRRAPKDDGCMQTVLVLDAGTDAMLRRVQARDYHGVRAGYGSLNNSGHTFRRMRTSTEHTAALPVKVTSSCCLFLNLHPARGATLSSGRPRVGLPPPPPETRLPLLREPDGRHHGVAEHIPARLLRRDHVAIPARSGSQAATRAKHQIRNKPGILRSGS